MRSDSPASDISAALNHRGGKWLGSLSLTEDPEGRSAAVPVAVVTGAHHGPTAWVNASLHGDEYLGPATVARLLPSLEPSSLHGTVIATPVLNVPAFRGMQRADPAEGVDWNRAWAATGERSESHRIRERVASEILERCDLVLDLHSGGNRYLQAAFAVYPRVGGIVERQSAGLAKACGLSLVWADGTAFLEGSLIHAAARKGKAAALIEVAGEGKAEEHWVARVASCVRGALGHAGILPDRPNLLDEYHVFREFSLAKNRAEGLWERHVEPQEEASRGDSLGRVLDVFGQELETVVSPVSGIVLGMYTYGFVKGGETIAELGHDVRTEGPPD